MDYTVMLGRSGKVEFVEACVEHLIEELNLTNSKCKLIITQDKNIRKTEKCDGTTACVVGSKNKVLVITLNASLPFNTTLTLLAHEMVHVKQFASGKLRVERIRKKLVHVWLGKRVTGLHYYDQPWEKQAYAMERNLANGFLKRYESVLDIR